MPLTADLGLMPDRVATAEFVGRVGDTAHVPDDIVVLDNHLAFLAAHRDEISRLAAADRVRRTVMVLSERLSGGLS